MGKEGARERARREEGLNWDKGARSKAMIEEKSKEQRARIIEQR
jgi:hypothetical protein